MVRIVRREIRRRGFFGKLMKLAFVLFNILMLVWLVSYWTSVGEFAATTRSDAEMAGAAIGATLGTTFLIFFWAAGSVILGLLTMLTRGKVTIIEESEA